MSYDVLNTYSQEFKNYLAHAGVTGFDFYLTVQEVGTAEALRLVEEKVKEDA